MTRKKELRILYKESVDGVVTEKTRCLACKWEYYGKSDGDEYVMFSTNSDRPIEFAVGDYCMYRGRKYTLNTEPSFKQTAGMGEAGNAFVYGSVKLYSSKWDLKKAVMLDVTPTTGDYVAALGTNYTGSAKFTLFCGETKTSEGILTPICALAAKIKANLDRVYPSDGWNVAVDLVTKKTEFGEERLLTQTDEKVLNFDNTSIFDAVKMSKSVFDIDYAVIDRTIYFGLPDISLTGTREEHYSYGYGRGYTDENNQGHSLYQIEVNAPESQNIVTRLRVLGSTRNLPYRYYNKKYPSLSQSMFPTNLQLPDAFETKVVKDRNNIARKEIYPKVNDVLGESNDAYIDKGDNAEACREGVREGCAKWDGSDSNLKEIYPTIEGVNYAQLRAGGVADMDEVAGAASYPNYLDAERVDEILDVEDDANIGDGILAEYASERQTSSESAVNAQRVEDLSNTPPQLTKFTPIKIAQFTNVYAGKYTLSHSHIFLGMMFSAGRHNSDSIDYSCVFCYQLELKRRSKIDGKTYSIASYVSKETELRKSDGGFTEIKLQSLPDIIDANDATVIEKTQVKEIEVKDFSDVEVWFTPTCIPRQTLDQQTMAWYISKSRLDETEAGYSPVMIFSRQDSASTFMNTPFHIKVKDMGIDFISIYGASDEAKIAIKTGGCVAKEFSIGSTPERVTYTKDGKEYRAWRLRLYRAKDDSISTYYPSKGNALRVGDRYVLLNVELPEMYVKAAEVRLLLAASDYLEKHSVTQYTYVPSLDDIYIQRNYDFCEKEGDVTESIYWKLYPGINFHFLITRSSGGEREEVTVPIDSVRIKEGDGYTPKVEIKLSEDNELTSIQRLTSNVSSLNNAVERNAASTRAAQKKIDNVSTRGGVATRSGDVYWQDITGKPEWLVEKPKVSIFENDAEYIVKSDLSPFLRTENFQNVLDGCTLSASRLDRNSITAWGNEIVLGGETSGVIEWAKGIYINGVSGVTPYVAIAPRLRIGNAYIEWDGKSNALRVNGSIYATGGVSAYGSVGAETAPSFELSITNFYNSLTGVEIAEINGTSIYAPKPSTGGASSWGELTGKPGWIKSTASEIDVSEFRNASGNPYVRANEVSDYISDGIGEALGGYYTKGEADDRYARLSAANRFTRMNYFNEQVAVGDSSFSVQPGYWLTAQSMYVAAGLNVNVVEARAAVRSDNSIEGKNVFADEYLYAMRGVIVNSVGGNADGNYGERGIIAAAKNGSPFPIYLELSRDLGQFDVVANQQRVFSCNDSGINAYRDIIVPRENALKIGNAYLKYDSTNNALYVEGNGGTQMHFYATGGISAYSGLGGADLTKLANLELTGQLTAYKAQIRHGAVFGEYSQKLYITPEQDYAVFSSDKNGNYDDSYYLDIENDISAAGNLDVALKATVGQLNVGVPGLSITLITQENDGRLKITTSRGKTYHLEPDK